jgi:hypothetical protein
MAERSAWTGSAADLLRALADLAADGLSRSMPAQKSPGTRRPPAAGADSRNFRQQRSHGLSKVISERSKGLNLLLDVEVLDRGAVQNTRKVLQDALNALEEPREVTSS